MNHDSFRARYAAMKRQASDRASSTPEAVAWRMRDNKARARARKEREERFPNLTAENAEKALAYQEERIKHWHGVLS